MSTSHSFPRHILLKWLSLPALALTGLFLAIMLVSGARAASYTVTTLADNTTSGDGFCTLREAIQSANNAGNGDCGPNSPTDDTITFSVPGTITLSATLPDVLSTTEAGALTIDGGDAIAVSGNDSVRVFYVKANANLTLQNLTVTHGVGGPGGGGGLFNESFGVTTIVECTFSHNTGGFGGGLLTFNSGIVNISASTFTNNVGDIGGGLLNIDGTVTILDSLFSGNSVPAFDGGGAAQYGGTTTIIHSTFTGNHANSFGGGMNFSGGTGAILNSTFSENTAATGAAVAKVGISLVTIANSTFVGNETFGTGSGGGIYNEIGSFMEVFNSTLWDNGPGGLVNTGTMTVANTILANNVGNNCIGTMTDSGNNLETENTCGFTLNALVNTDPQLGTLTGNPAYFPLNPGSPAIDSGNDTICAAPPINNTSQNGLPRPQDGDGDGDAVCDRGSYELLGEATPTPTGTLPTSTPLPTHTPQNTLTPTATGSPTITPTPIISPTATDTPPTLPTLTPTLSISATPTPTLTETPPTTMFTIFLPLVEAQGK